MKPTAMHPAAERELDEVTDYYAAIDPDLADAFVDCFGSCKTRMTEHPLV
jgi:plasmid stabilization system protein ParE